MTLEKFVNGHPTDADLIRMIDSEFTESESVDIRIHLNGCTACQATVEELEAASVDLSEFLEQISPPARTVGHSSRQARRFPALRAAAILLLIGTGSMAVRPVRAWVGERISELTSAFSRQTEQVATTPMTSESSVTFAISAATLEVNLAAHQASGEITFVKSDDQSNATAVVVGGSGAESLVLLSGAVRIANTQSSVASYRITLPSSVSHVELTVAGTARSISIADLDSATVKLTP